MKSERPKQIHRLRYVVAIVIPALDHAGKPLSERNKERWIRAAHDELLACFGGSTQISNLAAPGSNIVAGRVLIEYGQTLVAALCTDHAAYLAKKPRLREFALRMQRALRQDSVLVVGLEADAEILQ